MILRALTNGAVSGDQTLEVKSGILGGVLITADGTNNAVVTVRRVDNAGKPILQVTTKIPLFPTAPFHLEDATSIFVSVSGTGAAAQFYEWVS